MRYDAVLFDFDYTLADATGGIVESVNYALAGLSYPLAGEPAIRRTVGLSLADTLFTLTGVQDGESVARFQALFRERADEVMNEKTELMPDAIAALSALRRNGVRVGIVTSKYHYRIDQALAKFGAAHLVSVIVGHEDVKEPKPSPEGIFMALGVAGLEPMRRTSPDDSLASNRLSNMRFEALRPDPRHPSALAPVRRALYVGDSIVDAEAARRAGVDFAVVLTGATPRRDLEAYPHIAVVESLAELLAVLEDEA